LKTFHRLDLAFDDDHGDPTDNPASLGVATNDIQRLSADRLGSSMWLSIATGNS
jgi:hypothetical protein